MTTSSTTAYTHLESLLLFQSLRDHGLDPQVFSSISELLKTNPHITQNPTFQSGRLSPDALRNCYLHILKEEIKTEQPLPADESPNLSGKSSRKRKAPSPALSTFQESIQYQHLIPKLVGKLYARYRSAIVEEIKRDEDDYEKLQLEVQGIQRGLYDEQLTKTANVNSKPKSTSHSPDIAKNQQLPSQQDKAPQRASLPSPVSVSAPVAPPPIHVQTDGPSQQQQPPSKPSTLLPAPSGPSQPDQNSKAAQSIAARNKKQQSAVAVPNSQTGPIQGPSPSQQNRAPPPGKPQTYTAPQPPNVGPNGSPYPHRSPYLQNQSQNAPSQGSPQPHSAGPPHPQPGHPPHIQPQSIQPFGTSGAPHYPPTHGPPQYSPTHSRFPGHPHMAPGSPNVQTPPQQRNFPPYSGHPPYHAQPHQAGQPPPQGGFMLPPFQVSPQDPSRAHQPPPMPQHYPPVSTPVNARQAPRTTPQSSSASRPNAPHMHPLVTHQRLSLSTPSGMRTPTSAFSTPRSAKSTIKGSARAWPVPTQVLRPPVADIDDFVVPESLPRDKPLQPEQPKAKATRKSRAKAKKEKDPEKDAEAKSRPEPEPEAETEQVPSEIVPEMETRQGRSRRKAPTRKARPGSIASSHAGTSARERSRSQSVISHTETVAADSESQSGDRVKSERGNSIDVIAEDAVSTPHMTTRRRGQQTTNKRKRHGREPTPEETEDRSHTPGLPKTVVAPRQFTSMCKPVMDVISSHKHASIFTTAVRAKDAEGYYEIIKRPTDLKTIQKGIAAGTKQVAAAASGDTPTGSPGGGGAVVELPMTLDNIPPKAILNSGQLEREIMRMFVNASMFNPGEEGVVEDARDMFESVQQTLSAWRSIERGKGRVEVEETPPVEDDVPTAPKRRKL